MVEASSFDPVLLVLLVFFGVQAVSSAAQLKMHEEDIVCLHSIHYVWTGTAVKMMPKDICCRSRQV